MAFHERSTAEGLSTPRLVRYIHILSKLAQELGKSFETARREDIIHLVAEIENRPLSDWTKLSYKLVLKKFYKWLRHSKGYPKEVDWIKTPSRIRNSILPADLLTEDDIKRLVSVATTPRDKALILTLYDSGARIGELLSLRIRNVEFDKYGAVLNDPTLGLALGLQKSTLSELGLAKVRYDDLTFPVEKLVGVRRTKDRREGPLSLYRMARYVPQSPSGMSPEDMSAMREFVAEVLPWATSGLKFLDQKNQLGMLKELFRPLGDGVVSVGQMRWEFNWPNEQLARLLSFDWLDDGVPFDLGEITTASNQVAKTIKAIPLGEFIESFLSWTPSGHLSEHRGTLWCPVCGGRTTVRAHIGADITRCRYCGETYKAA